MRQEKTLRFRYSNFSKFYSKSVYTGTTNSPSVSPPPYFLLWNDYRPTGSCKNSTERAHIANHLPSPNGDISYNHRAWSKAKNGSARFYSDFTRKPSPFLQVDICPFLADQHSFPNSNLISCRGNHLSFIMCHIIRRIILGADPPKGSQSDLSPTPVRKQARRRRAP